MDPATLGLVSLIVGAAVRVVKSEPFGSLLTTIGLRPVPKTWLPWLAVLGGAAMSTTTKLEQGEPAAHAAMLGLDGILSGLIAIGGHETIGNLLRALLPPLGELLFGAKSASPPPVVVDEPADDV